MNILNPINKSKYIEDNFKKFIFSEFEFEEDIYQNQFRDSLAKTGLLKGPYISKTLEFLPSKSIKDLIDEGIVHRDFSKLGRTNLNMRLRVHQETAIRRVADGHSLIITTGTGSGKTEAFLYPIINEILKEKDISRPGVRAIFLFPMNALVNDQFDRIRQILNVYPDIKYGFFTGLTKEKEDDSIRSYIESTTNHKVNVNEIRERDELRKNPPHLLFTNFSMLEYILLRPKDDSLLDEKNTDLWKFIVLDEAHVYKGALGIEVGMLLRRLQERIGHPTQFILTSATLGGEDSEAIKKIQDYGYRLTSRTYNVEDILFSKRINLSVLDGKYNIDPEDYLQLYNNLSIENIDQIFKKNNIISSSNSIEEKLYDLIIGDRFLYLLNDELKEARSFSELFDVFKEYGFKTIEQLAAFIELVCKCKKNDLKIMDLRYHNFIRTISGAYITLGEDPKISLVPRTYIDGYRAFEIGSCKKCNSMYIIGVINPKDNILYQNDDIDIYANYDEDEKINIDFFVLEDQLDKNLIAHDNKKIEKYMLCPKCGKIINDNLTNKRTLKCEHDDIEKIAVYRIKKDNSGIQNNLNECLLCEKSDHHGIIHKVNMGKEASTSLLTQLFFEAIDDGSEVIINDKPLERKLSLFGNNKKEEKEEKKYTKQILSFSDARQQASYATTFAEYNHHRLLRKRLLFEILKINNNHPLSYEKVENKLDNIIEKMDLFHSNKNTTLSSTKHANITLLEEILNVDGIYSGEGLGLFYFEHELITKLLEDIDDDDINELLISQGIKTKITKKELHAILCAIINEFRNKPAISYSGLTLADREKYFSYRMISGAIMLKVPDELKNENGQDIKPLVKGLISKNRINKLEKLITEILCINKQSADKLIEELFIILESNNVIENVDKINSLFRCNDKYFTLHSATDCKWYYCRKCKKITRFNPNNVCMNCRKKGCLEECDPNDIFKNNYYRNKYMSKKIERLIYEEHTAQLSASTAEDRQLDFKNKKINFLSCSTTFEMGIDIGSLENVLLRNVPPSPSNYVQRAGRAGRGQDTSAYVLTFCSTNSHDFNYFQTPGDLVNGICQTPVFTMKNYKIVIRHLLAIALSMFFREQPYYFSTVGKFYLEGGIDKFDEFLRSKPQKLLESCNKILSTTEIDDLYDGKWIDIIFSNDDEYGINFNYAKNIVKETLDGLDTAIKETTSEIEVKMLDNQKRLLVNDRNLVAYLSNNNLVPKYGFPTDLVELKIVDEEGFVNTSKYDLTRDMKIALSEYCPGSEIMVDKQLIKSKYINKRPDLVTKYYFECPQCGKTSISFNESSLSVCEHCGFKPNNLSEEQINLIRKYVTPKYGFIGIIQNAKNNLLIPKKTYTSPIKYIGNGSLIGEPIKIGNILEFFTVKNDELLVMNESAFFTCEKCGYSVVKNEDKNLPFIVGEHYPAYGNRKTKCNNVKLLREKYGYSFKTDVLKMFIKLPIKHKKDGLSFLYALLEGIALAFDIERRDIDGIFLREDDKDIIVLFDTVPGGAGHVKRLLNYDDMVRALIFAYKKVNQDCCDSACYNCIKNYNNQIHHKYLNRFAAKELIEQIMIDLKIMD